MEMESWFDVIWQSQGVFQYGSELVNSIFGHGMRTREKNSPSN